MLKSMTALLLSLLLAPTPSSRPDLLRSSTFERDSEGWYLAGSSAAAGSRWSADAGRLGGGLSLRAPAGSKPCSWSSFFTSPPSYRTIEVSAWLRGRGLKGGAGLFVYRREVQSGRPVVVETARESPELQGAFDWRRVTARIVVAPGTYDLIISAYALGGGALDIDDVRVEDLGPGLVREPGLYEVEGRFKTTVFKDSAAPRYLFPLPLAYASQAPLSFSLETRPPGRLAAARLYEARPGNVVAEVTFKPLARGEEVELRWSSIVLCAPRAFAPLPAAPLGFEAPAEARPWLRSTACVQAAHPEIRERAAALRRRCRTAPELIRASLAEAGRITRAAKKPFVALDAVTALSHRGSCTSNANLLAALLRANGIPARLLAGYATWYGPHQTHSIVEAYVPGYGWYPLESTRLQEAWPDYEQVQVAILSADNEDQAARRGVGLAGIPYLSLTESLEPGAYFYRGSVDEAKNCDHVARVWRNFPGASAADWAAALKQSRARWAAWLASKPGLDTRGRLATPLAPRDLRANPLARISRRPY